MKKYIAKFWRVNPQFLIGGYETTREIEARTIRSAEKKARGYENGCIYGSMTLLEVKKKDEEGDED